MGMGWGVGGKVKGSTGWRKAGSATKFGKVPREWGQRGRTGCYGTEMRLGKWNWKTGRRVGYFFLDCMDSFTVIYIFHIFHSSHTYIFHNTMLYFKYV